MGAERGYDRANSRGNGMTDDPSSDATESLVSASKGDRRAADQLMPLVYDRLRRLAAKYLRNERPGHVLQPTALVNEAYLGMIKIKRIDWAGQTHFFAMAAIQMRRVLRDYAPANLALQRVSLGEGVALDPGISIELVALERALEKLGSKYPRQCEVAVLRIYAGMRIKEIAHYLAVSTRTTDNDWAFARAWLARELGKRTEDGEREDG